MTDRELLELAARAAGYWDNEFNCYQGPLNWNPIDNDGDALRLAVKLRMDVTFDITDVFAFPQDGSEGCSEAHNGDNPYAATRRAIVRAAAEIGKGMK